jgi:uncharacterized membrane protein YphA (DoxX/SURF4 family)
MEFNKLIKLIAIILISILFIYSGITKIFNLNDTALGFHQKVNSGIFSNILAYNASQAIIIIAIIILLIAPVLMIIGISEDSKILLRIGSWLLIAFTIIATIIYHPITDSSQRYNLLKNLSIIGGLVMVSVQADKKLLV